METGDLSEWYVPGPLGGPNFAPPGALGGEWDSGSYTPAAATTAFAHTGSYSAKLSVDTVTQASGVRLFRWGETQQNVDLYFSTWYYIPQPYNVGGWSNIWQWKSKNSAGLNEPFFYLGLRNRPNGGLYLRLEDHNGQDSCAGGQCSVWDQSLADVPIGKWFQIEGFQHCAGDGSGHVTIWQDGVLIYEVTGQPTRYADGDCQWSVNAYGSQVTPTPFELYVDDAAISTVRIGSSPLP
jgi:hypothetical protein